MARTHSEEMNAYRITADAMFKTFGSGRDMHAVTMTDMIKRYGIKNKRVLAVGPGDCAQEYWFHDAGNSLYLIDIDENAGLEPRLQAIANPDANPADLMTYVIGDARHVSRWLNAKFDVIFSSGFTPDEAHRASAIRDARQTLAANPQAVDTGTWPPNVGPISGLCAEIINNGLADDGLYIVLSYASGPDVIRAKNYIPELNRQLSQLGLSLIEMFCLASAPGVHLVVAQKTRDQASVAAWQAKLADAPRLPAMHARTTFDHTTLQVWPGPARLGQINSSTVASRIWGEKQTGLEASIGRNIARLAPHATTAFYAGAYNESEAFFLTHKGLAVDFGWGASISAPAAAVAAGLVTQSVDQSRQYDLVFLSFIASDDAAREAAAQNRSGAPLFAPNTLSAAVARLKADGIVFYQGRTGGIDPTYDTSFLDRVQAELSAVGLSLAEAHCLEAAPGIFCFAATRPTAQSVSPAPNDFSFFSDAAGAGRTVRLWPRGA